MLLCLLRCAFLLLSLQWKVSPLHMREVCPFLMLWFFRVLYFACFKQGVAALCCIPFVEIPNDLWKMVRCYDFIWFADSFFRYRLYSIVLNTYVKIILYQHICNLQSNF